MIEGQPERLILRLVPSPRLHPGSSARGSPRRRSLPFSLGLLDCGRNCTSPAYRSLHVLWLRPVPTALSSIPRFLESADRNCDRRGGQGARYYRSHPSPPVERLRGSPHMGAWCYPRGRSPERPTVQSSLLAHPNFLFLEP